jgi:hypothetical protein
LPPLLGIALGVASDALARDPPNQGRRAGRIAAKALPSNRIAPAPGFRAAALTSADVAFVSTLVLTDLAPGSISRRGAVVRPMSDAHVAALAAIAFVMCLMLLLWLLSDIRQWGRDRDYRTADHHLGTAHMMTTPEAASSGGATVISG